MAKTKKLIPAKPITKSPAKIEEMVILLEAMKNNKIYQRNKMTPEQKKSEAGLDLFGEINFIAGQLNALTWLTN